MAIVSGTALTFTTIGIREDLADIITNISPMDRPFQTAIGSGKADNTFPEWQTDALAAAAANAQVEGDEAAFTTPTVTQRLGNRTQISRKTVVVSGTDDVVNKAGRDTELGYQIAKYGKELLRDIEFELTQKNGIVTGNSTTPRQAAALELWITTNVSGGTGYTSVAKTAGQPNAGATQTDGSPQRVFDEEDLKTVNQACYTQGGQPTILMVGPFNKRSVSAFTGNATRTVDAGGKRLQSAIDVYAHDFGELAVTPNRFSRDRTAIVIDPSYWELLWLRPTFMKELAATGDAEKRMLIGEWTLRSSQEAASGKIADLTTS